MAEMQNNSSIVDSPFMLDLADGSIAGDSVQNATKHLGDLPGIFADKEVYEKMDRQQVVYRVQAILPVMEGTAGGLFFGRTIIESGKVGKEYFMTKGHFHEKIDRAEFYWGLSGHGWLLLMSEDREIIAEKIYPGSLHYIKGHTAHRTVNIAGEPLIFGACWPADAGHNYQEIIDNGFSGRVMEVDGVPELIRGN